MTSYNQSKVSPRKEGKRAYSQNMVCNHENTLTSKGGFKVVPFIHEKPKLPLLLPSSITFIKTLKIFIFLSSLFEVLIMPRTGSIFFFWFRPFICAPEGFRLKNWRTWWNLAKISSEHCANYNSRWLHYILALHFIIELPFGSTYYHQVTVHGISYYKGKANTINYLFKNATIYTSQSALISWLTHNAWFLRLQNPEEFVKTKPHLTNSRNLLRHFSFPNFLILSFGTIFFSQNSSEMHRKLFQ